MEGFATGWSKDCGKTLGTGPTHPVNPGTPDLFDERSTTCAVSIPTNKWASNRTCRLVNDERYVGFTGGYTEDGTAYYAETVMGTLTETINTTCTYRVSLYAAAAEGGKNSPCGIVTTDLVQSDYNMVQVVLRKNGDCTTEKVVFTSPNMNSLNWTYASGTFSLTPTEAAIGFNRIEFRLTPYPDHTFHGNHSVFMDNVSLLKLTATPLNSDFTLNASNPSGSPTNYIVNATASSLPSGASHSWSVCEVDITTGADIAGTCMITPANWSGASFQVNNTFPGYCCNTSATSGNGTFLLGHKYRVTHATWGPCNAYSDVTKTVYMNTGGRPEIVEDISPASNGPEVHEKSVIDSGMEIAVFPNPSNGRIHVDLIGLPIDRSATIEVFMSNGSLVHSMQTGHSLNIIDLSSVPKGTYFVRVFDGSESTVKVIALE